MYLKKFPANFFASRYKTTKNCFCKSKIVFSIPSTDVSHILRTPNGLKLHNLSKPMISGPKLILKYVEFNTQFSFHQM